MDEADGEALARPPSVGLRKALETDLEPIMSLLQFYNYDCSEWLPISIGSDGRIALRPQLDYFRASSTRAYFIDCDGELAGFATVDDEIHVAGAVHNFGYFFIARRFKRRGVGSRAAALFFNQFPGRWQIWHPLENAGAERFWSAIVPRQSRAAVDRFVQNIDGAPAMVYCFDVAP